MDKAGAARHFRLDLHPPLPRPEPTTQYGTHYFNIEKQCVSLVRCDGPAHDKFLMGGNMRLCADGKNWGIGVGR